MKISQFIIISFFLLLQPICSNCLAQSKNIKIELDVIVSSYNVDGGGTRVFRDGKPIFTGNYKTLDLGDEIETKMGSEAEITFSSGSKIRIHEDTYLKILKLLPLKIRLEKGSVFIKIPNTDAMYATKPGDYYVDKKQKQPVLSVEYYADVHFSVVTFAGDKETNFLIDYINDTVKLVVQSGSVNLISKETAEEKKWSLTLTKSHQITVRGYEIPKDPIYTEQEEIDRILDSYKPSQKTPPGAPTPPKNFRFATPRSDRK